MSDGEPASVFDVAADRERAMRTRQTIWSNKRKELDGNITTQLSAALADADPQSANAKLSELESLIKRRKLMTADAQAVRLQQSATEYFGSDRLFNIIYADPPWDYESDTHKCKTDYPVMTLAQLAAMPVAGLAARDAVLVMWTTFHMLDSALSLFPAWGFDYKTVFMIWVKVDRAGNPLYRMKGVTRPCAEIALFGSRGKTNLSECHELINSILRTRPRGHSRKPAVMYDIIPRIFGDLPRIDLFGRGTRPDWHVFGNQTTAFANDWTPEQGDNVDGRFLPRIIDRETQADDRVAKLDAKGGARTFASITVGTSFGRLHYELDADERLPPEKRLPDDDHDHDGSRPCCRPLADLLPDAHLRNLTRIDAYMTGKGSYAAVRNTLYTMSSEESVRRQSDAIKQQQQYNSDMLYAINYNSRHASVRVAAPGFPATLDRAASTKKPK